MDDDYKKAIEQCRDILKDFVDKDNRKAFIIVAAENIDDDLIAGNADTRTEIYGCGAVNVKGLIAAMSTDVGHKLLKGVGDYYNMFEMELKE